MSVSHFYSHVSELLPFVGGHMDIPEPQKRRRGPSKDSDDISSKKNTEGRVSVEGQIIDSAASAQVIRGKTKVSIILSNSSTLQLGWGAAEKGRIVCYQSRKPSSQHCIQCVDAQGSKEPRRKLNRKEWRKNSEGKFGEGAEAERKPHLSNQLADRSWCIGQDFNIIRFS